MIEAVLDGDRGRNDTTGHIRTFTGRYVNPLALRASDICLEDIAHHLSLICRYTGACPNFYSVAQHCVLASTHASATDQPQRQLALLLHDAAEAYFNDLASPVKKHPAMKFYRDLEHETTKLIFCVFGLNPDLMIDTKPGDNWMFRREVANWWGTVTAGELITPWSPPKAKFEFLERFYELTKSAQET